MSVEVLPYNNLFSIVCAAYEYYLQMMFKIFVFKYKLQELLSAF